MVVISLEEVVEEATTELKKWCSFFFIPAVNNKNTLSGESLTTGPAGLLTMMMASRTTDNKQEDPQQQREEVQQEEEEEVVGITTTTSTVVMTRLIDDAGMMMMKGIWTIIQGIIDSLLHLRPTPAPALTHHHHQSDVTIVQVDPGGGSTSNILSTPQAQFTLMMPDEVGEEDEQTRSADEESTTTPSNKLRRWWSRICRRWLPRKLVPAVEKAVAALFAITGASYFPLVSSNNQVSSSFLSLSLLLLAVANTTLLSNYPYV